MEPLTPGHDASPPSADKGALDRIMLAFFAAVSFEPGLRPPYEQIHDLFLPRSLLIKNSGNAPEAATVAEFIAPRAALVRGGTLTRFREVELFKTTALFGNVAQRFSAYEKSGESDGAAFDAQGMITTQFVRTPLGWRVSSMAWDDERPGLSLPSGKHLRERFRTDAPVHRQ